jgi:hypothetical protein
MDVIITDDIATKEIIKEQTGNVKPITSMHIVFFSNFGSFLNAEPLRSDPIADGMLRNSSHLHVG